MVDQCMKIAWNIMIVDFFLFSLISRMSDSREKGITHSTADSCKYGTQTYLSPCQQMALHLKAAVLPFIYCVTMSRRVQLISPVQNGHYFADDIVKCIFLNEKFCISISISLKFVTKSSTALVQVMAWRRTGDKPLPESMLKQLTNEYIRH